jgi:hypothetical protein
MRSRRRRGLPPALLFVLSSLVPAGATVSVGLLEPQPLASSEVCADAWGFADVPVRLAITGVGAPAVAATLRLVLVLDGHIHSELAVGRDAALLRDVEQQVPFAWPARVSLYLARDAGAQQEHIVQIQVWGERGERGQDTGAGAEDSEGGALAVDEANLLVVSATECAAADSDEGGLEGGPRVRVPVAGSHLCREEVALQVTGLASALQRWPHDRLEVQVHVDERRLEFSSVILMEDGMPINLVRLDDDGAPVDSGWRDLLHPSPRVLVPPDWFAAEGGWHTVSLEVLNKTSAYPMWFLIYHHVVVFRVSSRRDCLTWAQSLLPKTPQWSRTGRRRTELEAHQWRQSLRLLDSLIAFPPLAEPWRARGVAPAWFCREYSGFCYKNYYAGHAAPLPPWRSSPYMDVGAEEREGVLMEGKNSTDGCGADGCHGEFQEGSGFRDDHAERWRRAAQRSKWTTFAPPIEAGCDVMELGAISSALLRFHAAGPLPNAAFVVIELGAGMGRWSLETLALGRRLGVRVRCICVEAEPTKACFLRDAFWEMGVDTAADLELLVSAVGARDGEGMFTVGNAREWWGQHLLATNDAGEATKEVHDFDLDHCDCLVRGDGVCAGPGEMWGGDRGGGDTGPTGNLEPKGDAGPREDIGIMEDIGISFAKSSSRKVSRQAVRVLSLKTIIGNQSEVDIINMDCQGAELDVIRSATAPGETVLNKVKMMVISTHSQAIENRILALLCAAGWHLVAAVPMSAVRNDQVPLATKMLSRITSGPTDGVQIWANPLHVDVEAEFGVEVDGCYARTFAYPFSPLL